MVASTGDVYDAGPASGRARPVAQENADPIGSNQHLLSRTRTSVADRARKCSIGRAEQCRTASFQHLLSWKMLARAESLRSITNTNAEGDHEMTRRQLIVARAAIALAMAAFAGTAWAAERPDPIAGLAELGKAGARGDAEAVRQRMDVEAVWRGMIGSLYDFVPEDNRQGSREKLVSMAMEREDKETSQMLQAFSEHYQGKEDLAGAPAPETIGLIPSVDTSEYDVSVDGDKAVVIIPVTGATDWFNEMWKGAGKRIEAIRVGMSFADEQWRVVGATVE